jgi:hypothetical protein
MSKFLTDSKHAELKQKADSYDAIVAALVKRNPDLKAEDVTLETVTAFIESASETEPTTEPSTEPSTEPNEELQNQLDTANARILELETENANLLQSAGGESAEVKTKTEVTGEQKTLADFAKENKGDTQAILAQAKEEGLL